MSRVAVICTLALLAGVALVNAMQAPVPLVMWSGKSHFPASHPSVDTGVNSNELNCVLHALTKTAHNCNANSLVQNVQSSADAPSVIVAFVVAKMGTQDFTRAVGAFGGEAFLSQTATAIHVSGSSITAPLFFRDSTGSNADMIRPFGTRTAVFDSHATGASIVAELRAQSIGTGAKTDVVIVNIDELSSTTDALIQTVTAFVSERTQKNFVAILTADSAARNIDLHFDAGHASRSLLGFESIELQQATKATATDYPGPQYITSNIWLGLMVAGFLVFTLFVGISVVTSIQPPVRYPRRNFQVKKEY